MKKILSLLLLLVSLTAFSQRHQHEKYYQDKFAELIYGRTEVVLDDRARVDIVTDTFAIEVDFAPKWAESIGQSLYYAEKLHKKAGVLLIIKGNDDQRYTERLITIAKKYNITIWFIDYTSEKWKTKKFIF
ncbi:MAG: hypothetical protein WC428_01175 [Candidatus Paceibacterota bacterium]|jgi:hypothetical protein